MPGYRKLGRKSDIRRSMLRGMVTTLLVNGKIETTNARALEIQRIAEKLITLAVREQANFSTREVTVSAAKLDDKGRKLLKTAETADGRKYDVVERELQTRMVQVDNPSRLAARRQLMRFMNEHHTADGKAVNTVNHLFNDLAPKYMNREGGYTRIIKLGQRRGDAALMARLELV